jgi:hypothetical protein
MKLHLSPALMALLAAGLSLASASGCTQRYSSGPIPWWKGIPASVLSPSSQEAFGWKKQRYGHQWEQEIYPSGGSYAPAERTLQRREASREPEVLLTPQETIR